jgi:hypothetical protein
MPTVDEKILAEIVADFAGRGLSRVDAERFLDHYAAPSSWPTIQDLSLRRMVEEYRAAVGDRKRRGYGAPA